MRIIFLGVPALLLAGCAAGPDMRAGPLDPQAKAAALDYRSAFEEYRAFKDGELRDWRGGNDDVGATGGHGGHK